MPLPSARGVTLPGGLHCPEGLKAKPQSPAEYKTLQDPKHPAEPAGDYPALAPPPMTCPRPGRCCQWGLCWRHRVWAPRQARLTGRRGRCGGRVRVHTPPRRSPPAAVAAPAVSAARASGGRANPSLGASPRPLCARRHRHGDSPAKGVPRCRSAAQQVEALGQRDPSVPHGRVRALSAARLLPHRSRSLLGHTGEPAPPTVVP